MTRRIVRSAASWLGRWGFAALVAIGCALAIWVGATVDLPDELPPS